MNWKQKIEAQIAKCREKYHGGYADTMQALLDDHIAMRDALERIAGYDVLDPTGYQGVDAYAMADIAREALKDE